MLRGEDIDSRRGLQTQVDRRAIVWGDFTLMLN